MIVKTRREAFGGIVFCEKPGFVSYVNKPFADSTGMTAPQGAIMDDSVYTAPLDVHMALTSRCNMWCKGCYAASKDDPALDMPFELAEKLLDNFARLRVLSVSFGGGEPTLHPRLFEIAAYARQKNILPNITTNGLNLTADNAADYAVFGNVHLSLHAPRDMENVLRAARDYRKATHKKPGLNLLMTAQTLPFFDEYVREAKAAGFRRILFLRYKHTDKNAGIDNLDIPEEVKALPARLLDLSKKYRMQFLFDCSFFETLAPAELIKKKYLYAADVNGCMGGNAYIAVDIHGRYKPCSFWNETFGDAATLDFKEWHDSPQLNAFRQMRRSPACEDCSYGDLCRGGCRLKEYKDNCGVR